MIFGIIFKNFWGHFQTNAFSKFSNILGIFAKYLWQIFKNLLAHFQN
jgi:hypothetical protein